MYHTFGCTFSQGALVHHQFVEVPIVNIPRGLGEVRGCQADLDGKQKPRRPRKQEGEYTIPAPPPKKNKNNKKGRKCALAHTARTVRGDIDQRKVES